MYNLNLLVAHNEAQLDRHRSLPAIEDNRKRVEFVLPKPFNASGAIRIGCMLGETRCRHEYANKT